jgi:tetratricopeptide (TPR) repeat protein
MKFDIDIAKLAATLAMLAVTSLLPESSPAVKALVAVGDVALEPALKKLIDVLQSKFAGDQDSMSEEILRELKKRPGDLWLRAQLETRLAAKLTSDRNFRKEVARIVQQNGELVAAQKSWSVPPAAALHQLPADIAEFTGRQEEVAALLVGVREDGTAPSILVVTGIGGSGKSALARHTAQMLRPRFPDIQLYVDLQGAGTQPMDPGDVLVGFLRALDVGEADIPLRMPERAAMYRSLLSGKRAIVLLDNARDEQQVFPLLPGEPCCVVLITSRWSLKNLEGKTADLHLRMLNDEDAQALLERSIGRDRIVAEPEAARQIIHLCDGLPLAVRIAGGQLSSTGERLSHYAAALEDEKERLQKFNLGNLDVWASFMLSYWHLGRRGARLFRLLGLLPGESFMPEAAEALVVSGQQGLRSTRDRLTGATVIKREHLPGLLNKLVDMQWLEPIGGGRYKFHDLMRVFATERLSHEKQKEHKAACLRLARWYVGQTREMNDWLVPERRAHKMEKLPAWMNGPKEDVSRNEVLNTLTWFEMERANLLASVEWAHEGRDWKSTWSLAENLSNFYNIRCHWKEWEHTHTLALEATRRGHSLKEEGAILNQLGNVYRLQGNWDKGEELFLQALYMHRRKNDALGESITLNLLGNVYRLQGRWDEAIALFLESLDLNRTNGNEYGEGIALGGLGNVYRMQGRWQQALDNYKPSLVVSERRGDDRGKCITLDNMALVYLALGRLDEAEATLADSLSLCNSLQLPRGNCIATRTLGELRMRQERWEEAFDLLNRSLELAREQEDQRCICQSLNSLGCWYLRQGKWEQSSRCFEEALFLLDRMGDRHGVGLTLRNKGRLLNAQGRVDEAREEWQASLEKLHPDSPEYADVTGWLQEPVAA